MFPFITDNNRFPPGRIVSTPGALAAVNEVEMALAIARHLQGDWGELDLEDKAANERALTEGARLLSVYRTVSGTRFYIITEWDRSVTTILLPSEY